MAVIYLHDGSFEGLLSAVALAVKADPPPNNVFAEHQYLPQLFDTPLRLKTDRDQAQRLFSYLSALKGKASKMTINAFLSEDPAIGGHLVEMVRHCLRQGAKATIHYSHDSIHFLDGCSRRVQREAHKYKGLIRFSMLQEDMQYAPLEPHTNVVGYLARHFQQRLNRQQWILHDIGRDLALWWDTTSLHDVEIDPAITAHVRQKGRPPGSVLAPRERRYRKLWRSFHTAIAIPSRHNRRLQHQFIPRRFWKYLVESDGGPVR